MARRARITNALPVIPSGGISTDTADATNQLVTEGQNVADNRAASVRNFCECGRQVVDDLRSDPCLFIVKTACRIVRR